MIKDIWGIIFNKLSTWYINDIKYIEVLYGLMKTHEQWTTFNEVLEILKKT